MWDRRHIPLFVAVCLSVLLHVATIGGVYKSGAGPGKLDLGDAKDRGRGRGRREVTFDLSLADPTPPAPSDPPKSEPAGPKKSDPLVPPAKPDNSRKPDALQKPDRPVDPAKPKPPAPPQAPQPKPPKIEKYPDEMGDKTGTGVGANQAAGEQPLQAREADEDQGFLSRDPAGPGKVGNQPSQWLLSPGENGRGGHPGAPAAASTAAGTSGASGAAARDAADPAAATLTTPPREVVPPAPALPSPRPEMTEVTRTTAPPAAVQKAAPPDESRDPSRRPPAPAPLRIALAPPRPEEPEPKAPLSVGPLVLAPRPAAAPPTEGDAALRGDGEKGVKDESLPQDKLLPDDRSANLPRATSRPSAEPGHRDGSDGTDGVIQVAVPRVAPVRAPDPDEAPPKPIRPGLRPVRHSGALARAAAGVAEPDDPGAARPAPAVTPASPPATSPARGEGGAPRPACGPAAHGFGRARLPVAGRAGHRRRPPARRARPAADPAQMSDSESDAFSKIGSAQFRDGRLDVRFGRKIKTTRPHIPIVGQIDAFALRNPEVTLKVDIDPTGKVTEVKVHKSSGSNEIDTPCLEAMYDWWFEPLKDAGGKPIPDTVLFTINFR